MYQRGHPTPIKTEAPRQTGPESRVTGKETPVPPEIRRWVPPSLIPQHGLSQEAKNDAIHRKVRGILNKLTPEKFQKLTDDLLKIDLNSPIVLKGVILLIFEKALDEPKYSSMYAQLCKRLSNEVQNFEYDDKKNSTFLSILLSVCHDKFNNRLSECNDFPNGFNHLQPVHLDEEERKYITKQKMLGNVKFIGELFKLGILHDAVLHKCIQELLSKNEKNAPKERCENMECLSQIIRTCGKMLDTEKVYKLQIS